jgi:UPF0755 protein
MKKRVIILTIGLFFMAFFVCYSALRQNSQQQLFYIKKGAGLSQVAYQLKQQDLIFSEKLFKLQAVLFNYDKKLRPGEYWLKSDMFAFSILQKFALGKVAYRKITIPEGLTVAEIIQIINSNKFLTGEISFAPKEGFLLPETYSFIRGDSRNSIIKQMEKSMQIVLDDIWKNRDVNKYIKDKQDLLNLASIVEKETQIDAEKPVVASVYLNRLKRKMRLQADPTVIYGSKNYQGDITYKMLREKNEYNTYVIKGLPKTPIANPGLASIVAVANPVKTSYLYFVADGKGGHIFSENYAEHKKNVKNYLKTIQ